MKNNNAWFIPGVQSIHIVGIAVVMGSALMIYLRILGWGGTDQTLRQTTNRFLPWLTGSLWLMLATGILMVVAEPVRELVTFSFWMKMFLVALMAVIASAFQRNLRNHDPQWGEALVNRTSAKWVAVLTFLVWTCIIILGRLIAYDNIWGRLSPKILE